MPFPARSRRAFALTLKDCGKHFRATDRSGKMLFEGDVTSEPDRAKVPTALAAKLKQLEEMAGKSGKPPIRPAPPKAPTKPLKPGKDDAA